MTFFPKQVVCYLAIILFSSMEADGQPLKKGDACPDLSFKDLINYNKNTLSLSDFRGKMVILDFWSINCLSCIESFPDIETLQKQFAGKIQVLMVSKENSAQIKLFFQKHPKIKAPDVPFITGDSLLISYFPHSYVPVQVWLDFSGKVIQVTDGYNATAENIKSVLDGKQLELHQLEYIPNYDFTKPAIAQSDLIKYVQYYSYLMPYVPGLDIGNYPESTDGWKAINRIVQNGSSILQLFQTAYGEGGKYDFSKSVILEIQDSANWTYPVNSKKTDYWISKYCFNYEIRVPQSKFKELYKMMQDDLNRFFDVNVRVDAQPTKCLALVLIRDCDSLRTKGGKGKTNFFTANDDSLLYLQNLPFERLVMKLQFALSNQTTYPFIDETKYSGKIDIRLSTQSLNPANIQKLRNELNAYGLDLVEKTISRPVLIIKDN